MRLLRTRFVLVGIALVALLVPVLFGQGFTSANPGMYWVPPGACNSVVSADPTGTQGLTVIGASNLPVMQAQSDNTAVVHTHTYICTINPPQAVVTSGTGFAILDAVFMYGTSANLGTQVVVLASGTLNGLPVFSSITYPTSAATETPTTVTPVRADSGTLVITPVVASFNGTATTAGSLYSMKFTPATPIAWKTNLKQLLLTVKLVNTTTTATTTYTSGVLVHLTTR